MTIPKRTTDDLDAMLDRIFADEVVDEVLLEAAKDTLGPLFASLAAADADPIAVAQAVRRAMKSGLMIGATAAFALRRRLSFEALFEAYGKRLEAGVYTAAEPTEAKPTRVADVLADFDRAAAAADHSRCGPDGCLHADEIATAFAPRLVQAFHDDLSDITPAGVG